MYLLCFAEMVMKFMHTREGYLSFLYYLNAMTNFQADIVR